jgi:hypothetical protein
MTREHFFRSQQYALEKSRLRISLQFLAMVVFGLSLLSLESMQAQQTYSLSGRITASGVGLEGTQVIIRHQTQGGRTDTVTTNQSGFYELSGLASGNYFIRPQKSGFMMQPLTRYVTISNSNLGGVDFTSLVLHSVRGRITKDSAGVVIGVEGRTVFAVIPDTLSLTPYPTIIASTNTSADGTYNLAVPNGRYDIAPNQQQDGTVLPIYRTVTVQDSSIVDQNFRLGALQTRTLNGRVVDLMNPNQGIPNEIISYWGFLSNQPILRDTTDNLGRYSFTVPLVYAAGISIAYSTTCSYTPQYHVVKGPTTQAQLNFRKYCHSNSGGLSGIVTSQLHHTPLANVQVLLISRTNVCDTVKTLTNEYGAYSFGGTYSGQYTVKCLHQLFTFRPDSTIVSLAVGRLLIRDFVAQAKTFHLSGRVTHQLASLPNIQMTVLGRTVTGDSVRMVSETNPNGTFRIPLIAGQYLLQPEREGYSFTPPLRTVMLERDMDNQNFAAQALATSVCLSGRIMSANTTGLANIEVRISPINSLIPAIPNVLPIVRTDAQGNYRVCGLPAGRYQIMPISTSISFTPFARTVALANADVGSQDFVAVHQGYCVSGRVLSANTTGLADALITLTPLTSTSILPSITVRTGADGAYRVCNLVDGLMYRITAAKAGFDFRPTERTVVISGNDLNGQDFVAVEKTYCVSGRVLSSNLEGIGGIEIRAWPLLSSSVRPGAVLSTRTDTQGYYSFCNMQPGQYSIQPVSASLSFVPETSTVSIITENVTNVDFAATTRTACIRGRVTDQNGMALSGVAISAGLLVNNRLQVLPSTATDANGEYQFCHLQNGRYMLGPVSTQNSTNGRFGPLFRDLTLEGRDITGIDFVRMSLPVTAFAANPNPTSGQTNLRFSLTRDVQSLRIDFYSYSWQLLGTIETPKPYKAGNYEIPFTVPANLASGLYILRLQVDGFMNSITLKVER